MGKRQQAAGSRSEFEIRPDNSDRQEDGSLRIGRGRYNKTALSLTTVGLVGIAGTIGLSEGEVISGVTAGNAMVGSLGAMAAGVVVQGAELYRAVQHYTADSNTASQEREGE